MKILGSYLKSNYTELSDESSSQVQHGLNFKNFLKKILWAQVYLNLQDWDLNV